MALLGTALVGVSAAALRSLEPWPSGPVTGGGALAMSEASGVGRPSTDASLSWTTGPGFCSDGRLTSSSDAYVTAWPHSFCSEQALIVFLKDGLRTFQILWTRCAFDE